MSPLEAFTAAMERKGCRRQRPGSWQCPAHEDRKASLAVKESEDGTVLLTCHANCDSKSVVEALGLTMADLFPPRQRMGGEDWTPFGPATATYLYVDEQGRTLFGVCRTVDKQFPQWRPDPSKKNGRAWKLTDAQGKALVRRVLYRLPRVITAVENGETVYVVEGEKDAHALEVAGVTATCNPGGAGKWRSEYTKTLAGASVVIVADNDEPGRKHAREVAAKLSAAGCTVRVVRAAEGKDASDHLNAERGLGDFIDLEDEPEAPAPEAEAARPRVEVRREDGAAILEEVERTMRRYVHYFSGHQPVAVALWAAHTHAIEVFDTTAYVHFTSPEPESGKTRNLEVLEHLVARAWLVEEPSEAVMFRKIDAEQPTVLLDEVDALWSSNGDGRENLRALLNAGYRRGAKVPRCVGDGAGLQTQDFAVFCAKAFAGIKELPGTVATRCVPIRLQRRAKGEKVERFRLRHARAELAPIRDRLDAWVSLVAPELGSAEPDLPEALSDRQQDCWEPLLAVADAAGGDWPKRARAAAVALHGHDPAAEPSTGTLLLECIHDVFADADAPWLATEVLLGALVDCEAGPAAEWWARALKDGNTKGPAAKLAHKLKPYGIKPGQKKVADKKERGYMRGDFDAVFSRYLGLLPDSGRYHGTSQVTGQMKTVPPDGPVPSSQAPDQQGTEVPSSKPEQASEELFEPAAVAPSSPADARATPNGDLSHARTGSLLDPEGNEARSAMPVWYCDRCGHSTTAWNDMADFPHPCTDGGRGHFQAAERAATS